MDGRCMLWPGANRPQLIHRSKSNLIFLRPEIVLSGIPESQTRVFVAAFTDGFLGPQRVKAVESPMTKIGSCRQPYSPQ